MSILTSYPVKATYPSLKDAIAAGEYDRVSDHITAERFELKGEIIVDTELMLYHPDRDIRSDDVVKELGEMGLRPATLEELCAFGEKYPDIQREFPVLALGSVCEGIYSPTKLPPCLLGGNNERGNNERELNLVAWGIPWGSHWWFLAAPK